MAKLKRPPKRQMRYWLVGWRPIRIRARTARAAVRKWMRGNRDYDLLYREWEYYNPHQPQEHNEQTASEALRRSPYARKWAKTYRTVFSESQVPVREAN